MGDGRGGGLGLGPLLVGLEWLKGRRVNSIINPSKGRLSRVAQDQAISSKKLKENMGKML